MKNALMRNNKKLLQGGFFDRGYEKTNLNNK